MAVQLL